MTKQQTIYLGETPSAPQWVQDLEDAAAKAGSLNMAAMHYYGKGIISMATVNKTRAMHRAAYAALIAATCCTCGGTGKVDYHTEGYQTPGIEYKEWIDCWSCNGTGRAQE